MSEPGVEHVRSADGTRIAYRRIGSGPAVVLLHGGLGSWRSWEQVARLLADAHELFLVDRRGRGDSDDGPQPHALAQEVEDARAVLRVAGPGAALAGHSFGGLVALETARVAEPGELAALVLYEPAIRVARSIGADDVARLHAQVDAGTPELAVPLSMQLLDAAGLVTADGPLSRMRVKPTPAFRRLAATVPNEIGAVVALGDDLDRWTALDVPTLLLIGTASPPQARANCEALAGVLADATVVRLEGLGHVAHTTAPDRVAEPLAAFLDGHAPGPAGRVAGPGRCGRS